MVHPVLPPGAGPGSRARATTRQTTTRQTTTRQTATRQGPPCCVCGVAAGGTHALCFCCRRIVEQLHLPLTPLVSMAEYRLADRLHRWLRGYKDAPVAEARLVHRCQLAGMVGDWLDRNGLDLARRLGSGWDVVTAVPSSRRPSGPPVDAIVSSVPALADRHRRLLVRGSRPVDHLVADRLGFVPAPGVEAAALAGQAVLLVDDSVATGARARAWPPPSGSTASGWSGSWSSVVPSPARRAGPETRLTRVNDLSGSALYLLGTSS